MARWYVGSGAALSASTAAEPAGSFTLADNNSHLLVPVNFSRVALRVWNLDFQAQVFGALGTDAVANQGFLLNPQGGDWETPADTGAVVYTGAIYVISPVVAPVLLSYVEI